MKKTNVKPHIRKVKGKPVPVRGHKRTVKSMTRSNIPKLTVQEQLELQGLLSDWGTAHDWAILWYLEDYQYVDADLIGFLDKHYEEKLEKELERHEKAIESISDEVSTVERLKELYKKDEHTFNVILVDKLNRELSREWEMNFEVF